MGHFKEQLEEDWGNGYTSSDEVICAAHVEDKFIAQHVLASQQEMCDVCGEHADQTCTITDICALVMSVIRSYRHRAHDELYFDREAPSGYTEFGRGNIDTADTFNDLFEGAFDDDLAERIVSRLHDHYWFDPNDIWLEGRHLYATSWDTFRVLVEQTQPTLHQLRNGASDRDIDWPETARGFLPSELPDRLVRMFHDLEVVSTTDPNTIWYRAQHLNMTDPRTAARLGTAPAEYAQANRMSAADEPMFYATTDIDTALKEIGPPVEHQKAVIGVWQTTRPLKVVDLWTAHDLPDLYDVDRHAERWARQFLNSFAEAIAEPPHADAARFYRPTQLLTRHFLNATGADGIIYRSRHTRKLCAAFDISNDACTETPTGAGRIELHLTGIIDNEP